MFGAMNVPFLDLWRIHEPFAETLGAEFSSLIERGSFVNGPEIVEFEEAFAAYCGTSHCVGVATGLDALRLALIAAGIGAGEEVIVPAHTFVATVEAVDAGRRHARFSSTSREADFSLDARRGEACGHGPRTTRAAAGAPLRAAGGHARCLPSSRASAT